MKVKKLSAGRKLIQPTPEVSATVREILQAPQSEMSSLLGQIMQNWKFGKSDLHNWAPVLDRFDSILQQLNDIYTSGPQTRSYTPQDKNLILDILMYERLLLENCSSRNLFNAYDRLNSLLLTNDMEVLESTLELMVLPARKLEAHKHLHKTYNQEIKLTRLKLLAGVLLPEEFDEELAEMAEIHKKIKNSEAPITHIRLISLYILLMLDVNTYDSANSVVFSVNPLIIEEIANMLTCNPVSPMKVEAAALFVMRACLKFDFKSQEISNALNLPASHGTVMNLVRILNAAFCSPEPNLYTLYYLTGFTDMLYRLLSTPDYDAELLNAGILEELIKTIENCQPHSYRHVEKYVYGIDSMISKLIGTMDAFMAADGFNFLVRTIGKLVTEESHSAGKSSYISALLKLVEKVLLCHGSDERLRNLAETPIFTYIRHIFENGSEFGADTVTRAMYVMSTFVHNEPNTLAILQEINLPRAFLSLVNNGLPANAEFISKLLSALSALCLNEVGRKQVEQENPFKAIFSAFLDRTYSRSFISHSNSAAFGQSIDEFMRHQPLLKNLVIDQIIDMLTKLPAAMRSLAQEFPGYSQFVPIMNNTDVIPEADPNDPKFESDDAPVSILFEAVAMMLETVIQNPNHYKDLAQAGMIPLIVTCLVEGDLPFDFSESDSAHSVSHFFRLVSESEDNVLFEELTKHLDFESLKFNPEILQKVLVPCSPTELNQLDATLRKLIAINNLTGFLCKVYIHSMEAHLRTASSMVKLIENSDGAIQFFSNLINLSIDCRKSWLYFEPLPKEWLKTVLEFEGKENQRPIDLILVPKFSDETKMVSTSDPRIKNLRIIVSVLRDLMDSVVGVFSAFSRSSTIRRISENLEESKVVDIMYSSLTSMLKFALSVPADEPDLFIALSSFAFFIIDSYFFEDVSSSRVSLLLAPVFSFTTKDGPNIFKACISRLAALNNSDIAVMMYCSIGSSFLDIKSYRTGFWDDVEKYPAPLQIMFELLAECNLILIKSPFSLKWNETTTREFCYFLAHLIKPDFQLSPSDTAKADTRTFLSFCDTLLGVSVSSPSKYVSPSENSAMKSLMNHPQVIDFIFSVYIERGDWVSFSIPIAAIISVLFSAIDSTKINQLEPKKLFRLFASLVLFNSGLFPSIWPIIKSNCIETQCEDEEVNTSLFLILSQLISAKVMSDKDLSMVWNYTQKFLSTSMSNPNLVHAILQTVLAFSLNNGVVINDFDNVFKFLLHSFKVGMESSVGSHDAIIHLVPLIMRIMIERNGNYYQEILFDEIKGNALTTKPELMYFSEFFGDPYQSMSVLYPEAIFDAFKILFCPTGENHSYANAEDYRHFLKSDMKLSLNRDANFTLIDYDESFISKCADSLLKSLLVAESTGFARSSILYLISELAESYKRFHHCILKSTNFVSVLEFMFRHMLPAMDSDFTLNETKFLMTDFKEKMKMEGIIERAWCQYFVYVIFATTNTDDLNYGCKLITNAVINALKQCQSEPPESAMRWLFGIADMIYHLLSVRLVDEPSRKLVISKIVSQLIENKAIVMCSLILKNSRHHIKDVKVKEGVETKVMRSFEILSRYGNRLRKAPSSANMEIVTPDNEEAEDDYGYESFDEEEDNPIDEEAEILAEAEEAEVEMHSDGDMMDIDDVHSMTSEGSISQGDEENDDLMDIDDYTSGEEEESDRMLGDDYDDEEDDEEDLEGTDFEYEIEIDQQGGSHYLLRPEDVELSTIGGSNNPRAVQRFVNRIMERARRPLAAAAIRDDEEEDDYITVNNEPQRRESNNTGTSTANFESEADAPDDETEELDRETVEYEFGNEDEAEDNDQVRLLFEPFTSGGNGRRRLGANLPLPGNTIQILDQEHRSLGSYASIAQATTGNTLPLHSFYEENLRPVGPFKALPINTICTPITPPSIKRWNQIVNLFKVLSNQASFESVYDRLEKYFIDLLLKDFKPFKPGEHPPTDETTGHSDDTLDTNAEDDISSEGEDDEQDGEEIIFEDLGVDIGFLEAMPFEMRQEVLEQHFEERRAQAPSNAVIQISPQFLNSLPDDLRNDYIRLSYEETRRHNLMTQGGADGRLPRIGSNHRDLDLVNLLQSLDPLIRSVFRNNPMENERFMALERGLSSVNPPAIEPFLNPAFAAPQPPNNVTPTPPGPEDEPPAMVDLSALSTLMGMLYEPLLVKEKRVFYKTMLHFCSNTKARNELMGLILLILEESPADLASLSKILENYAVRSVKTSTTGTPVKEKLKSREIEDPESEKGVKQVIILQRTLQLLMYLVSHDKNVLNYFWTESEHLGHLYRQLSQSNLHAGQSSHAPIKKRKILPITSLLSCLESPSICSQGLLVEYILHLLSILSSKFKGASSIPEINIPETYLTILVRILLVCEFTQKSSIYANQAFASLAQVPSISNVLIQNLNLHSDKLLDDLAKDIRELTAVSNDIQFTNKIQDFSHSSSSQNRLLRIYKILNTMVSNQPDKKNGQSLLHDSQSFHELYNALSAILIGFEEKVTLVTGILPAVESFFLYYKIKFNQCSQGESADSIIKNIGSFSEQHRKTINSLIRNVPTLLLGSMSVLSTHCPHALDFDNKRIYFKSQLHKRTPEREKYSSTLNINVRRSFVFEDSYHQVMTKSGQDFRYGRINLKFFGEEGIDGGGVTREWFSVLSRAMFNPDYALFKTSAVDKVTYQPNRMSSINPDHLQYFRFVGRIIAKAINDGRVLDCYFTRSFYKCILGRPVDLGDLEAVDPEIYRSLQWMLNNDITDVIDQAFSVEVDNFGHKETYDLIPQGRTIQVTEENKQEYVKKVAEYRLFMSIKQQVESFLGGFHEVIPQNLISIFNEQELELLISGLPEIDVDDWKNNSEYSGYTAASPQIQWFWRAVRAMSLEERAKLIQFVTGTSKVPLEGFSHLQGSNGRQKFQIHKDFGHQDRLPCAHTCFNQLDLPEYENYEKLRDMLKKAIGECATGFGLA
jgi:hypothetical protein